MSLIALIDVNSFYASCEQVFRPDLWGKPVAVLSNNDGCIVAANAQAKALGIPMWGPYHEARELFQEHNIAVFSSNYALYGDMSQRVMETIASMTPALEVYSIDEAFCEIPSGPDSPAAYGGKIHQRIHQWTGLPVCVGIGPTKTLAKVANRLAKSGEHGSANVYVIDSDAKRIDTLKTFEMKRVWGVGRNHARRLQQYGIRTALEFTQLSDDWVRKHLTVVGLQMKHELQGRSCLPLECEESARKMIGTAKSFGQNLSDKSLIAEALAWYVSEVAEKLRKHNRLAGSLNVSLKTNRFRPDTPQYSKRQSCILPEPTNDTRRLNQIAQELLDQIYKPGFRYKKVEVWASGLVLPDFQQLDLYDHSEEQLQHSLMRTVDALNARYGKAKVRIARSGYRRSQWKLRQEHVSPRYTTQVSDILRVGH